MDVCNCRYPLTVSVTAKVLLLTCLLLFFLLVIKTVTLPLIKLLKEITLKHAILVEKKKEAMVRPLEMEEKIQQV